MRHPTGGPHNNRKRLRTWSFLFPINLQQSCVTFRVNVRYNTAERAFPRYDIIEWRYIAVSLFKFVCLFVGFCSITQHTVYPCRTGYHLLSRRSRQRERLHATGVSICWSVGLSVCRQIAKTLDFLKN